MPASPTLRAWLREGPFTLAMSSGFFGFFAHTGALAVLEEEALLPTALAGSSAGALVAGAWAAGLSAAGLGAELVALRREDFWDPRPGLGLLAGRLFRRRLEAILPARTFAECRAPLAVSAYDLVKRRVRVLDAGPLAPAVHASCAVPGLFHPVRLDGALLVDGGVADRPGLAGVPAGARVLFHHLPSPRRWPRHRADAQGAHADTEIVPVRAGLVAVAVDGLPRVGPFRLAEGPRALEAARAGMRRALARALDGGVVRV